MSKDIDIFTGTVTYFVDDKSSCRHRDDGPAVEEKNGAFTYFIHGISYRTDGPCTFNPSGKWSRDRFGYRTSKDGWYISAQEFAREYLITHLREYTFSEEKKLGLISNEAKIEAMREHQHLQSSSYKPLAGSS